MERACRSRLGLCESLCALLVVLSFLALPFQSAVASCPPDSELARHVVFLEAEFRNGVRVRATGVLVSEDGLILTEYQLLVNPEPPQSNAGAGASGGPKFWASKQQRKLKKGVFRAKEPKYAVKQISAKEDRGLLLLKAASEDVREMKLRVPSMRQTPKDKTKPICSVGYTDNPNPEKPEGTGTIKPAAAEVHWRFDTNYSFAPTQQGSPVFDESGHLVGLASGYENDSAERTEVIDVEYAKYHLSPLFAADLNERVIAFTNRLQVVLSALAGSEAASQLEKAEASLQRLAESVTYLRQYGEWVPPHSTPTCPMRVTYKKLFGEGYNIAAVLMKVDVIYTDSSGDPQRFATMEEVVKAEIDERNYLSFCPMEMIGIVKGVKKGQGWKTIDRVDVSLNPYVEGSDGEPIQLDIVRFAPIFDPTNSLKEPKQ